MSSVCHTFAHLAESFLPIKKKKISRVSNFLLEESLKFHLSYFYLGWPLHWKIRKGSLLPFFYIYSSPDINLRKRNSFGIVFWWSIFKYYSTFYVLSIILIFYSPQKSQYTTSFCFLVGGCVINERLVTMRFPSTNTRNFIEILKLKTVECTYLFSGLFSNIVEGFYRNI